MYQITREASRTSTSSHCIHCKWGQWRYRILLLSRLLLIQKRTWTKISSVLTLFSSLALSFSFPIFVDQFAFLFGRYSYWHLLLSMFCPWFESKPDHHGTLHGWNHKAHMILILTSAFHHARKHDTKLQAFDEEVLQPNLFFQVSASFDTFLEHRCPIPQEIRSDSKYLA